MSDGRPAILGIVEKALGKEGSSRDEGEGQKTKGRGKGYPSSVKGKRSVKKPAKAYYKSLKGAKDSGKKEGKPSFIPSVKPGLVTVAQKKNGKKKP